VTRKPAARSAAKVKQAPSKAAKSAKAASAKSPKRKARTAKVAKVAKAPAAVPRAKPVHEWAEAIKKAALQNKQGHNPWPGASTPWKGKQRPE